jgi:hypothetical protein
VMDTANSALSSNYIYHYKKLLILVLAIIR